MEMIAYDLAWYKSYERSSLVDEAKKYLEYAAVVDLIRDLPHCGASLDIGTATGRYMLSFHRFGYHVHGIDVSPDAVEITRSNLAPHGIDSSCVLQMDVQNMDLPDAIFKVVTCMMGTLAHIARPDQALTEIHRVLSPGGVVLLSNWQPQVAEMDFLTVNTDAHNAFLLGKSFEFEKTLELITAAGLVLETYAYAVLLPSAAILHLLNCCEGESEKYLERLALMERQLRQLFPRLRGQMLIMRARKPHQIP